MHNFAKCSRPAGVYASGAVIAQCVQFQLSFRAKYFQVVVKFYALAASNLNQPPPALSPSLSLFIPLLFPLPLLTPFSSHILAWQKALRCVRSSSFLAQKFAFKWVWLKGSVSKLNICHVRQGATLYCAQWGRGSARHQVIFTTYATMHTCTQIFCHNTIQCTHTHVLWEVWQAVCPADTFVLVQLRDVHAKR